MLPMHQTDVPQMIRGLEIENSHSDLLSQFRMWMGYNWIRPIRFEYRARSFRSLEGQICMNKAHLSCPFAPNV